MAMAMIKLSELDEKSKDKSGYKEEMLSLGQVKNDILFIEPSKFEQLRKVINKYNPNFKPSVKPGGCCGGQQPKLRGLGDLIALVAQPIAKAIDKVIGTDIQNCSGCKKRQEKGNQLVPF